MPAWQLVQTHPWASPLDIATAYAHDDMALLYSSLEEGNAQHSFLLLDPIEHFTGSHWRDLPPIPTDAQPNLPYYIGYLGYGMRERLETTTRSAPSIINLPDFHLTRYNRLLKFDHRKKLVEEFAMGTSIAAGLPLPPGEVEIAKAISGEGSFTSSFTRAEYETCITRTIERIQAGDFYQANITRKFWGEFSPELSSRFALATPGSGFFRNCHPGQRSARRDGPRHKAGVTASIDYLSLFAQLCALSPAPYSAYIRHGDTAILSSSPECFLEIAADGTITSRPIKGSARRDSDPTKDKTIREALTASPKNLAENLMITDLMRHDLAQVSTIGSVKVQEQSTLHSYQTIHHLVSTIAAQKSPDKTAYDVTRACFPPGSMTGAPKIAAMQWCTQAEQIERGVYSGALGWFGGGNTCALSVVIRTLICKGTQFEFQVGGGIVADSTPEEEWRETLTKARAITQLLDIKEEKLKSL